MKKLYRKCYRVNHAIHTFQKELLQEINTTYKKNLTFSELVNIWWELMHSDDEFRSFVVSKIEQKYL